MTDAPSERTRVRRYHDRGRYDAETVHAILDEALICHLGVVVEGAPRVIPTIHARIGDTLYLHGSNASRTLRALKEGGEACVTVTIIDGLVLSRSAFGHSMNYRSVIVYGLPRLVEDPGEKAAAQRAVVEHVVPGRSEEIRMPSERELAQTTILALPLDEASAKVRTGTANDPEEEFGADAWAGVIPVGMAFGAPEPDPALRPGIETPAHARDYRRP